MSLTVRVGEGVEHMHKEGRKIGSAEEEATFAELWRGLITTISASKRTNMTDLTQQHLPDLGCLSLTLLGQR